MAVAALQGNFTHPDPTQDVSIANAYFVVIDVSLNRERPAASEAIATYRVYTSLAKKNRGKRCWYETTFPFNYAPGGGNAYNQATQALKALPDWPGLVDV